MSILKTILSIFLILAPVSLIAQESLNELLITAADRGDTATVQLLIRNGADVNASTYEGVTPLMFAAMNGHTAVVRNLVKNGAKTDTRTYDGNTALSLSIQSGYIETAEFLIRNGADINLSNNEGISPLMHAIRVDSFYLPDMLLYYGAKPDHKDVKGRNALMFASEYGSFELVVRLLEAGVNINETDNEKNTALHYAVSQGHLSVIELLAMNGAELEARNSMGYTPLSFAVGLKNYKASLKLIGYGADVNSRITSSLNPLTLSINNQSDSITNLLLNHDAHRIRKPSFNQFYISLPVAFNRSDLRTGLKLGYADNQFHLMPGISYSFRPQAIRILEKPAASTFYQFWERRHFLTLSLDKAIFITRFNRFSTGAYAGIAGALTWGSYRGADDRPDTRLLVNPGVGAMFQYGNIRLKTGYEFMDLKLRGYDSQWFNIAFEVLFDTRQGKVRLP